MWIMLKFPVITVTVIDLSITYQSNYFSWSICCTDISCWGLCFPLWAIILGSQRPAEGSVTWCPDSEYKILGNSPCISVFSPAGTSYRIAYGDGTRSGKGFPYSSEWFYPHAIAVGFSFLHVLSWNKSTLLWPYYSPWGCEIPAHRA